MNLRTYQAPSMHEALALVKKDMGKDAVILHTRTFRKGGLLGMGGRNIVEITAATGVNVMPAKRRAAPEPVPPDARAPAYAATDGSQTALAVSDGPRHRADVPGAVASVARAMPAVDASALQDLRSQLDVLRGMVAEHVRDSRRAHGPALPPELLGMYQQLLANQVEEQIVFEVFETLRKGLESEQLRDEATVKAELRRLIEASLPVAGGIGLGPAGKPRIVAFIGPTGVGKTTTIAKLAAHFKLRARRRVGLITIDTYRIAAVDQLRTYANILDVPLQVVLTPRELTQAIARLADRDLILIDTAGRCPSDPVRVQELKSFLEAAGPDEVHLVLSSAASETSLLQAVEKFGQMRIDRILFTKLDEAVGFGVILNVLKRVDKALSYITMGQDVPDDIAPGKRNELAALIIGDQPTLVTRSLSLES